jgi:hypothetical protein
MKKRPILSGLRPTGRRLGLAQQLILNTRPNNMANPRVAALQDSLCERRDWNHGLELADGVRAGSERLTQMPFKRWPESLYGWLGLVHLHRNNIAKRPKRKTGNLDQERREAPETREIACGEWGS